MFADSTVTASIGRIRNSLKYSLKEKYGIEDEAILDKVLKIHGLSKENFDFVNNLEGLIEQGIVDLSIDQNSNKSETSMAGLYTEVTAPIQKLIGYRYLYRKMKELYGKKEAKKLTGEMYDFSIAISDSTKIMSCYCWAMDASKIVIEGRPFGQLPSAPPKRLGSYIAALNETVHQLSNHLAGAIAVGSFFLDTGHLLMFNENFSMEDIDSNKKYIENCFQNFIHSINHLSRNSNESPFVNVSIFDRPKLRALISDDNMGWYFEGQDKEYVVEYIMKLQEIFMDFFDGGDKLNGGSPFRFPVVTLNITKNTNADGVIDIEDTKFVDMVCHHEIYRYNVMVSAGSKVCSCCRLISDSDMLDLGGTVNSFGGTSISLGSHRVATIDYNRIALETSSYEDYMKLLDERIVSSAKILKAHKELMEDSVKKGLQPFISNGYISMNRMFSTFGIIGIVEAAEILKKKYSIVDGVADTLMHLNKRVAELSKEYNIIGNIEQIPGESMAVKLADVDRLFYGEEKVPNKLYANQFIPLWEEATVWERMDTDARYQKLVTGGGIVHFSIGEKVTASQAYKLIMYACKSGCEHFALNSVYSKCSEGHTTFGNSTKCPECGADIVEKFTRVVGFFVPVSSMNKTRREWEFPRRVFGAIDK